MRIIILLFLFIVFTTCKPSKKEELHGYSIEEGFELEVIASEPHLIAPVAIDFDTKGRIWVAEMNSYMKNTQGSGMEDPTGRILILEDEDDDGIMETSKEFLTGLVLPRALALVYGGLLYAEPPNLWFVEIENDQPGKRVLVDSLYATSGNPEHQPNGLMLNIDNWIYNAKSQYRYRLNNGVWEKELTTFRGQWGIAHDNFGRLYYNNNYTQLIGDYVLPNLLIRNQYLKPTIGVNEILTTNQRVYPLHAASVNRGYIQGVLDDDSLLVNVTASCGPQVYRGDQFPDDYLQNVFVCVPEANLIKRNILTFEGDKTEARQAWDGKEFLASLDEGFRPVNISNGPDGNLYIVDMHRGIIGHYAYLSPYLKEQIKLKKLDSMINMGRILKVSNDDNFFDPDFPDLDELDDDELVEQLESPNGWLRDRAQHLIIYKNLTSSQSELEELALDTDNPVAQIHALYTLEGLDLLSAEILVEAARESSSFVTVHSTLLLSQFISTENVPAIAALFKELMNRNDKETDLYLSFSLGGWMEESESDFRPLALELMNKYHGNTIFEEAFISGLRDNSNELLTDFQKNIKNANDTVGIIPKLSEVVENQKSNQLNSLYLKTILPEDDRTKGWKIYRNNCAACHGPEGLGIEGLAPPLMNSEYISQSTERLGLIILHGLKGPVYVQGKLYDQFHSMPGYVNNEFMTDENIADIIAYVTSAFSGTPRNISIEKIKELRKLKPESGSEYTEKELMELYLDKETDENLMVK